MDCCDNSGSTVILTINGQQYSVRGNITVRPSGRSTTAEANADGTMYVNTKAELYEMDISISDRCGLTLDITGCFVDVTARCPEIHRTYVWTRARVVGRPSLNMETGEISGLMVKCPAMRARSINSSVAA